MPEMKKVLEDNRLVHSKTPKFFSETPYKLFTENLWFMKAVYLSLTTLFVIIIHSISKQATIYVQKHREKSETRWHLYRLLTQVFVTGEEHSYSHTKPDPT